MSKIQFTWNLNPLTTISRIRNNLFGLSIYTSSIRTVFDNPIGRGLRDRINSRRGEIRRPKYTHTHKEVDDKKDGRVDGKQ